MLDKNLLRAKISFMRAGAETQRYHTHRKLHEDTVGHHSHGVACLVMLLSPTADPERRLLLLQAALTHDLAEHVVGDVPSPVKRKLGVREAFGAYEQEMMQEIGLAYEGHLNEAERRILKLADMMDGCFHCIGEASLGNRRIGEIYVNFRSYIRLLEPSGPVEEAIVEYIDDLWASYGEEYGQPRTY